MSTKYLNDTGLSYFWGKLKAWANSMFAPIAHTHTSYAVKHSYTTAANAAKNWYRIANANTHQMDTSKPLHVQFLLTAWNSNQPADYYEQWFVNCEVFGRNSGLQVFGNTTIPFSQIRVLYENTVADIDTNDRPAIDIYLNYALATACHVEIQEVYNSGWTFLADGVLAASTVPTGFENRAVGIQGSGVHQATNASYSTYTSLQRSNITANITLANSDTYRMRVLNCTNAITVTVPSLDNTYAWFLIKNFNATSTTNNVTIHPSTTSVKIDDSNADIVLKPGEWIIIASKAANSYSLIGDSRWKSQKADKATTLAGYGITDAKIQNGTITLGSSSITPLTSVPSHNQASNTINAMTGYSKPSSTSAIASSDTLNQAIGKLEKAVDDADISNVVHRTGDETVNGIKTFSNAHAWFTNGPETLSSIDIKSTVLDRNAIPAEYGFAGLIIFDKNATSVLDLDKRLAALEFGKFDDGGNITQLKTYRSNTTANDYSLLAVGYDPNDVPYASAPSTSTTRTDGNDIVTRNFIPNDTRILHTTGDESISGNKSFNNTIIGNTYYAFKRSVNNQRTVFTGGTDDGDNSGGVLSLYGKDYSNNNGGFGLLARKDANTFAGLFGYASGHLEWNSENLYNLVHRSGDETISGNKTFNSAIYANEGLVIETSAVINGVSKTHKISLDINNASLNAGIWDYTNSKWVYMADVDGNNTFYGNASTATKLATARTIRTNLASTSTASFDGSANITPGVTGTLPVTNGGTGLTSLDTFVRTTGNQSISGIKTFIQSIRVATNDSGDNTYSLISNDSNYGSWNFAANQWLWYTPHSGSFLYFYRALCIYGGLQLEGASRAIVIKETDFNAAASGESGWAEIKHQDKNDVVNTRIILTGEGNKYSRILLYTKQKNSTTTWTGVGLFDEETGRKFFMPSANTSDNALELGGGGNRWKVVYSATGSINTSDERLKLGISSIPDAVLDAWMDSDFLQFRFTDAVEEKGDGARLHTGMVAQRIASAFAARGLDASRYGLFCHDSWDAEPAMTNDDGEVVSPAREAGDRYSLRYEEALCMEAALMRRENARLKARIAALEDRLAALELRVASS